MKRYLCTLLALALLLVPVTAARAAFDYESIPTPNIFVADGDNLGNVFYERNADQRAYPASTTKIMTCILAIESGDLDASVTVGEEVTTFSNYSSLLGLKSGETVTLRDLIYGLMVVSGNDAGAAIAVHVAGSIPAFVDLMNAKAASLGMNNTHFMNPHGVQDDNHYTTARDMAKLMVYALKNETFCEVDATKTYTVPATNLTPEPRVLNTTNRLLRRLEGDTIDTTYQYAIGGKTGDTDAAGKCLVAVAERDGARVIIVLFGDRIEMYNNDKELNNLSRFINAKNIFEYVFENEFASVTGAELGLPTAFSVSVPNAAAADLPGGLLPVTADLSGVSLRAASGTIANYQSGVSAMQTNVETIDTPRAPIAAGQLMGYVHYLLNGEVVCSAPLLSDRAVAAAPTEAEMVGSPDESPFAPTATPLIKRGGRDWSTGDYMLLALALLVVLLIALIVVFVITERKRRFERKRRRARMRSRSR